MEYRRLGDSGLSVSVLGLGGNNFGMRLGETETQAVVEAALDAGVTLFDTSDSYGESEVLLGKALRGRRDEVVIATKFGSPREGRVDEDDPIRSARGGRRYVRQAVERSLARLGTDWIDLYQLHFPDPITPVGETLEALTELVQEGKVRYIGCSNLSAWQVTDAVWTSRARGLQQFISAQNEYSLLARGVELELIPALESLGLGLLPYFPLASGLLTGRYRRGESPPTGSRLDSWGLSSLLTDRTFDVVEGLEDLAERAGATLLEVAFGGLTAQPSVASVIAGVTSVDQLVANVEAVEWMPGAETLAALRAVSGRTEERFSVVAAFG